MLGDIENFFDNAASDIKGMFTGGKKTKRSAKWFGDKIKGLKGELKNKFSSMSWRKSWNRRGRS